ncbi:Uncharacterised protein [uncultured archaeon]|nr:Uncharacterised protein [uncultured archaeon]
MVLPKQKFVIPRMKTARQFLSPVQSNQIFSDNRKTQLFRNLLSRSLGLNAVPEIKLRSAARTAARIVLEERNALKLVQVKKGKYQTLTESFAQHVRLKIPVVFKSGVRARIEFVTGGPIHEFREHFERSIRVMVKPIGLDQASVRELNTLVSSRDYINELAGSIGYLGLNFAEQQVGIAKGNAVLDRIAFISVAQERGLPSLKNNVRKRYSDWAFETISVVEEEAKRLGIKRIAFIDQSYFTGGAWSSPELDAHILKKYGHIKTRLLKNGWRSIDGKSFVAFDDYDNKIGFGFLPVLVKEL